MTQEPTPTPDAARAELRGLTASLRTLQGHVVTLSRRRGVLLVAAIDGGVPVVELAADLGMTRQAVHKLAAAARDAAASATP